MVIVSFLDKYNNAKSNKCLELWAMDLPLKNKLKIKLKREIGCDLLEINRNIIMLRV